MTCLRALYSSRTSTLEAIVVRKILEGHLFLKDASTSPSRKLTCTPSTHRIFTRQSHSTRERETMHRATQGDDGSSPSPCFATSWNCLFQHRPHHFTSIHLALPSRPSASSSAKFRSRQRRHHAVKVGQEESSSTNLCATPAYIPSPRQDQPEIPATCPSLPTFILRGNQTHVALTLATTGRHTIRTEWERDRLGSSTPADQTSIPTISEDRAMLFSRELPFLEARVRQCLALLPAKTIAPIQSSCQTIPGRAATDGSPAENDSRLKAP